jgi:hypothetical protein
MTRDHFEVQLSDSVDRRREEITHVRRVVAELRETTLAQTTMLMAIPMLYAHWEGFVKESVELYIEYIEKQPVAPARLNPIVFSFAIRKSLALLIKSGSVDRISDFAKWMMAMITTPIKFEDKTIETRANLSFANLKALCETLSIDVAGIEDKRRNLDGLVHRRNNIAHTGRPPNFDQSIVEGDANLVIDLISTFEKILKECVVASHFMSAPDPAKA